MIAPERAVFTDEDGFEAAGRWTETTAPVDYVRADVADELLAALKYARRFLRAENHDVAYVDAIIAKAEDGP